MTMPGRSCVALTLLIFFCGPSRVGADCSLERLRISEIQAGQEHGLIQNDSRHAGGKNVSNANQQYKCSRFPRSIGLLCRQSASQKKKCSSSQKPWRSRSEERRVGKESE